MLVPVLILLFVVSAPARDETWGNIIFLQCNDALPWVMLCNGMMRCDEMMHCDGMMHCNEVMHCHEMMHCNDNALP